MEDSPGPPPMAGKCHQQAVIIYGDSIAARGNGESGWVGILQKAFPEISFINLAHDGRNSEQILTDYSSESIDSILAGILCVGTNDLAQDPERYIPRDKYKVNLRRKIDDLASRCKYFILITPPAPLDAIEEKGGKVLRSEDDMRSYGEAMKEVGRDNQDPTVEVRVLDAYALFDPQREQALEDNVHPSEHGNALIAEGINPMLKEILSTHGQKTTRIADDEENPETAHSEA